MPTYTFITDYKGGTYICQKEAKDLTSACMLWKEDIALGAYIPNLNIEAFIQGFNDAIEEFSPIAIDDVKNVWLFHLMLGEDMLDLHIVKTDVDR